MLLVPRMPTYMERHLVNLLHSSLHINQFKQVHALIITQYPTLAPTLIQKLLKVSFVDYGRQLFDQIPHPDQYLYNTFISAYTKLSLNKEAVECLFLMHRNEIQIDCFAIPPALKSCSSLLATNVGKQIHSLVINCGFDSNVFVQTALMDFYAKTGDLDSARQIFDGILIKDPVSYNCLISGYSKSGNVLAARELFDEMKERTIVSWNSMISCYAHNGDCLEGLRIFERMQVEKYPPNEITLVTVLSMCAKLGDLETGLRVKKLIDDNNLGAGMIISTAIMEMLIKCGSVDEAREEFDKMVGRDVVAWSAMISGYAQNGRSNEALELFELMKNEQIKPNNVTLVSILSACAQLGSVEAGECIGNYVESLELFSNVHVASALLGMYSRCGNIIKARQVFDRMPCRDIVTWNSMIAGLAFNGFAEDAIALFEKLMETEVRPDDVTFVGLLTACTHSGLVDLGLEFFRSMRSDHDISPKIEHYACIVDLFCRSGRLKEAYDFICRMEIEPNVVIWGTLLSASNIHRNVELAELSVQKLLMLEPENSGNYVLLSNMYASVGRWREAWMLRKLMKDKNVQKTPAYSWVEVGDRVHRFLVGDTLHPRSDEIFCVVYGLAMQSIWAGYDLEPNLQCS
ncbi:pentatricopeptide repeat-containing protein At1g08070, chloroplastic-like [Malania oleifera]|uniref:pentatricopeptide repeat-containing protein At1g08070, chloroplastic-like n=1 Tax=Malania oleifera TaxID=397392 RepID=UPI0025AECD64|nr:pentatricopeptide repeat-containing protein At1g08070, chloroplastic-like [Malania oleifera]